MPGIGKTYGSLPGKAGGLPFVNYKNTYSARSIFYCYCKAGVGKSVLREHVEVTG